MIDEEKFNKVYDKFTCAYGQESEYRMCIEEMSELTKELCKLMRYSRNDKSEENDNKIEEIKKHIIEETADVIICASQIKRLFGESEVEKMMNFKIERGEKIVDNYIATHKIGDENGKTSK